MEEQLIKLGVNLAEIVGKNSIEYVKTKMEKAKKEKDLNSLSLGYSEIINQLLAEKSELIFIAQGYKQAYEQVIISDDDIEYLHNTLKQVLTVLAIFSPNVKENEDNMRAIIQLLNKDLLKTIQLLGFNYKEAIGQPLTEVCSMAIRNKLSSSTTNKSTRKK